MKQYGVLFVLLSGLVFGVLLFNLFLEYQVSEKINKLSGFAVASTQVASNQTNQSLAPVNQGVQASGPSEALLAQIIPKGVPPLYGEELSVSFDEPEKAIKVLSEFDGGWAKGEQAIKFADLGENEKQRYLKIGSSIACEFCCGARTLIAKDGEAACGCAHSAAMRGLAKYLLKNHASEFSDEQVLEELVKIKTLSFPKQMVSRALQLQSQGKPLSELTQSLPSQVGGC